MKLFLLASLALLALAAPACAQAPVQDTGPNSNNAAFQGEVVLVVGTPDTVARRSLKATCTAAGTITVLYPDGSTGTWPVQATTQALPLAVVEVLSQTATCIFANLR